MSRRAGWAACVLVLAGGGCEPPESPQGVDGDGGSGGASGSGAAGSGATGGSVGTGGGGAVAGVSAGGTATGGMSTGGTRGAMPPPWEILHAPLPQATTSLRLLSDGNIYFTTRAERTVDYQTDIVWTLYRLPKDGGDAEEVAISLKPMRPYFADSEDLFVTESQLWDATYNTWRQAVKRVSAGAPVDFIAELGPNGFPSLMGINVSTLYVQYDETTWTSFRLYGFDRMTGEQQWSGSFPGEAVIASRFSETELAVITYDGLSYAINLADRSRTPEVAMPNLCRSFLPHPSHDGWLGLCGTSSPYDVASITRDGSVTTIATAVLPDAWFYSVEGNTVYQNDYDDGTYTIESLDIVTQERKTTEMLGASPFAIEDGFVYVTVDLQIARLAL